MSTPTPTPMFTREQIEEAINDGFQMAADESGVSVTNADFRQTQGLFWEILLRLDTASAPGTQGERTYTRDQVQKALNEATDAGPRAADDIDNFAVNATLTLLDDPDAAFGDIVTKCYDEDADMVAGWLTAAA